MVILMKKNSNEDEKSEWHKHNKKQIKKYEKLVEKLK